MLTTPLMWSSTPGAVIKSSSRRARLFCSSLGDSNARELQHTQLRSSRYMLMIAGLLSVRIRPVLHGVGSILTFVCWYLALSLTDTSHSVCIDASVRLLYLP